MGSRSVWRKSPLPPSHQIGKLLSSLLQGSISHLVFLRPSPAPSPPPPIILGLLPKAQQVGFGLFMGGGVALGMKEPETGYKGRGDCD